MPKVELRHLSSRNVPEPLAKTESAARNSGWTNAPWLTQKSSVTCESQAFLSTLPSSLLFRVIGLSDGLTVPFALTAGLSSLGESRLVVLGGIAELIAGAISMGIGGFLASQAERDHYRYLRKQTAFRVGRSCDGEIEREVAEILEPIGVDDKTSLAVTQSLRNAELHGDAIGNGYISHDVENGSLRWSNQVGLTAFLLKFGYNLG